MRVTHSAPRHLIVGKTMIDGSDEGECLATMTPALHVQGTLGLAEVLTDRRDGEGSIGVR